MNSKSRVLAALNHRSPDMIPLDLGGMACTGMHVTCVAALRKYYGLEKRPVRVNEPYQMLGEIDDELKEILGVDVEGVYAENTLFGFKNENWKEWRLDCGLPVLVPGDFNVSSDGNGGYFMHPGGDVSAPPSGHMSQGGFYFDAIIRQEPLDEDNLRAEDNLEEFVLYSDRTIAYYKNSLEKAAATGRAVLATFGGTGLGDVALVPATGMKHPKGIRDIEEWYISTVVRQELLHEIFEKQTDTAIQNLSKINDAAGELADIAYICGTDFGTQTGTFCSKETFRELYMPYYKKMNGWIHGNTGWKTFKHCCGAVEGFMELFIESGFDIINPVQCSAAGMDPRLLKEKHGGRLTFWGGGVDTQMVLPFGTPEEIREQVLKRCEIFSENGGFVFNAIHNIQASTPAENIAAMFAALREYNGNS